MPGIVRSHQISVKDHRLHYLYVAATHGSMRAAADLLGIAASSISRQVAQLERDLKIDLIEKSGHRMRLTAAGKALVDYYANRMGAHEDLLRRLGELRQSRSNILRIAIGDGLLLRPFTSALHATTARYDDTTIDLVSSSSYEVQRMVEEGSAQIGLILEVPADVRMRVHAALAQPIRLIVPNGHALAARASVDLATIARQRLILPAGNLRLAEILQSHFRDKEIPLSPVITSNLLQPIIDSVVAGLGLTMMPEVLVHRKLGEGVLAAVPIDCTDLSETGIMLITRPGHRLPAAGTLALTNLASAMAKLQPAD